MATKKSKTTYLVVNNKTGKVVYSSSNIDNANAHLKSMRPSFNYTVVAKNPSDRWKVETSTGHFYASSLAKAIDAAKHYIKNFGNDAIVRDTKTRRTVWPKRSNPTAKWISAHAVRIRKVGKRTILDILR